jgi:ATP-dependent Clp protease ATP-binding subunit ClpA
MAGKALIVLSVNCADKSAKVKYQIEAEREYDYSTNRLDRNTLIKVVGLLGHKFVGKSPLSYTQYELKHLADKLMTDRTDIVMGKGVSPTPSPRPIVPAPTVTATPTVHAKPAGIEDALRNVITEAMSAYTENGVDKDVVTQIVNEAIGHHVAETQKSIDALTRIIAESKPEVKHITLTGGDVRKIEGRTHFLFDKVLRVVDAGLSPWITGSAGVGKTMLAEQIATALGLEYSPESFCSQSSKAEVKGYKDGHGLYQSVDFRKRFEDGGVYLLDEIDAANPNILLTLNSALSNGWMMFPDGKVKRHEKFVAIASANTYGNGATAEYVGRQVIDGSTLNRFVKFDMPIDEIMEAGIVNDLSVDATSGRTWLDIVRKARANVASSGLKVIISPRDSYHGAKLLNAGFTFQECVPMTFGSGMKSEQYAKVMAGITMPAGGAKV